MKEISYAPVGRIFSKISRDLGIDDFSESDVVEWVGEALDAMDAVTILEECVAFIEVKGHVAKLPPFTKSIIQVAEHTDVPDGFDPLSYVTKPVVPATISEGICDDPMNCGPCDTSSKYIPVDENGYPIFDEDLYVWRPYFNVAAEYINWMNCGEYRKNWTPVRLANHSFFNTVVCAEPRLDGLYQNSRSEYTIIGDTTLRLSFQEGQIAVAYNRPKLDEDGYPMIPDQYSYITACTKYVTMMLMGRMWYLGREGYADKYQKAEADWQWYCKQAGNRGLMPRGIDQHQNMLDASQYLLPRNFRYNQFFMDLSRPEYRKYNDPDNRNTANKAGMINLIK